MFDWLKRLLHIATAEELRGAGLPRGPCWSISAPKDAARFARSLPILLGDNSIVYLEGVSMVLEPDSALLPRCVPPALRIALGTIWPRPEYLHLPATRENLDLLAGLLENHAAPEICDHLHAYRGEQVVLQWHDAFCKWPLYVSADIPESAVRDFCAACGCTYSRDVI